MQPNHAPATTASELVQQLNTMGATDKRAQLRALLPLVDQLVRRGVSHGKIVESLNNAGFAMTILSFRKALYRWRRRSRTAVPDGPQGVPVSPAVPTDYPALPTASSASSAGGIQSKADLVRLRKASDPIDLDELAKIGRKK
ncbi:hypothetical protein N7638_19770 [Achromobacter mucicolens]|uniref:hypothetical protein n=1 Tax=Achromobacter TaxID=222 RepID=UPI00244CCCF0|nr:MULTISPECIES: hypothetical protein [Achromobacter]MDG9970289.1 hypothetical protein [Achromobacter mucicolens]